MTDLFRLLRLYGPYRRWLMMGVGIALLTLVANVALMALSGWFIAAMAIAGAAGTSMNYFTPAAGIRALAILRTGGRYAERLVTHETTFRLIAALRVWFYERLEPLAPAALGRYRSGDLLSRMRADVDRLDAFYLRILLPLATGLLGILLFTLFLARQDPWLAVVNLGFLLLAGVALPLLVHASAATAGRQLVTTSADLRAALVDGLQGMGELEVFGRSNDQAVRVGRLSRVLVDAQDRLNRHAAVTQAGVALAANLSLWFVVLLAVPLVRQGVLPPANLAMIALFTLASFESVLALPTVFQVLDETLAAARRLFTIADAAPAVPEPSAPGPRPRRLDINLSGVWFRYRDQGPWVLEDIDLELPQGRRIAIVGSTGSGKSTLANLLLRFHDPQRGTVSLGGHALSNFQGDDVRRRIAVVSQHSHLFNASIRDNLLLANPEASQGLLERACRAAQIHDFIAAQPAGYETPVGEGGTKLSGGQVRRIAIARAVLKDTPILILDEPTEGLDAPTARELMETLLRLMEGRSVLLITHRLRGLEAMDEILVMDSGRIVERGSHRDLVGADTRYRRMCAFLADGAAGAG